MIFTRYLCPSSSCFSDFSKRNPKNQSETHRKYRKCVKKALKFWKIVWKSSNKCPENATKRLNKHNFFEKKRSNIAKKNAKKTKQCKKKIIIVPEIMPKLPKEPKINPKKPTTCVNFNPKMLSATWEKRVKKHAREFPQGSPVQNFPQTLVETARRNFPRGPKLANWKKFAANCSREIPRGSWHQNFQRKIESSHQREIPWHVFFVIF